MERLTERAEVDKCPGIWVKESFAHEGLKTWFNGYDEGYSAINKCAEYEDLEEQCLLKIFPCKVGDTVYFISERVEKQGRRKVVTEFVDKGEVDNITLGSEMIPQITVCNNENIWITFDSMEDFGKTVFLMQDEAEDVLKGMREKIEN